MSRSHLTAIEVDMVEGERRRVMVSWPIGDGELATFDPYLKQQGLSVECAHHTLNFLSGEVNVWHRMISDFRSALAGEHNFEREGRIQGHLELVSRLEVVALSTSKVALDCVLGGLYVQASMLMRHILETWQRVAYIFINPSSAHDWLTRDGNKPTPPQRGTFHRGLLKTPLRPIAEQVKQLVSELDLFAHPSYAILTAHDMLQPGHISLGGTFAGERARNLLRIGAVAQMLILNQHLKYMEPRDDWREQHFESVSILAQVFPDAGVRLEFN